MTDNDSESDRPETAAKFTGRLQSLVTKPGEVSPSEAEELDVVIRTGESRLEEVTEQLESMGIDASNRYGREIRTTVRSDQLLGLAESDAVQLIAEDEGPMELATEGVEASGTDLLHDIDYEGGDATIAVIDGSFNLDNPVIEDNYIGTIGSNFFDDSDDDDDQLGLHGTNCAEIVADMAPEADLILCSSDHGIYNILNDLESDWDVDVATMSLGWAWDDRIDGLGNLSQAIDDFTDATDSIFLTSAGNEAAGNVYNMPYRDDDEDGIVEFDDAGTERFEVTTSSDWNEDDEGDSGTIYVHWDSDWSGGEEFIIRLWEDETSTDPSDLIDTWQSNEPWEQVKFDESDADADQSLYLEIEDDSGSGDEHFDLMRRGSVGLSSSKPERSFTRPGMGRDEHLLSIAAVQVTSAGRMPNAEDLKNYSSRGPTQDGRRGIDLAAPSFVTLTESSGFNGTSAASPHVAGALGVLYDSAIGATRDEIIDALFDAGRGIADPSVDDPGPNNNDIGFGYLQVRTARDILESIIVELSEEWAYDTGSRIQYATPEVEDGDVLIGGLGSEFYALSGVDGSENWSTTRDGSWSDSSAIDSGGMVFVGSGGGLLYALDLTDGSTQWSANVGSAITSSPVVADGTVVAGTNDATVYGWDVGTQTQSWSASVDSMVLSDLAAASGTVFVTSKDGRVYGFDVASGSQEWVFDTGTELRSSSPAVADGTVYVAADELYALNAADGSMQWSTNVGGTAGSNPVVDTGAGLVYVGSASGDLSAVDTAGGGIEWQTTLSGAPIGASPSLAPERAVVFASDGEGHLIDTRLEPGETVATAQLSGESLSTAAVAGTAVFVGSESGEVVGYNGL